MSECSPNNSWSYRKKFEISDIICLILLASKLEKEQFSKDDMLMKMRRVIPLLSFTVFDKSLDDMIRRGYIIFKDGYYSITDSGREEVAKIVKII